MKRVVITSMGAITPVGNNVDEFYKNLVAGQNGIDNITRFDTEKHKVKLAAEVKNFDAAEFMDKKEVRRTDRFVHFAMTAAKELMDKAKLETFDEYRAGVIVGSGVGGLNVMQTECFKMFEKGPARVSPFTIPSMIINMAGAYISMEYKFKGMCYSPVTACATGVSAIGQGFMAIKNGTLDLAICGGTEAAITEMGIAGFANMGALNQSEDPSRASIPFDKERSGFVMGEGAGLVLLEEYEHAKARGANILCEIFGFAETADAYHITSPSPEGESAAMAMKMVAEQAGISMGDIDYINAHGTSTPLNDKYETIAIKKAFLDDARNVSISSTKSMTGHMLGAAGAVETIICAMSVINDTIPPTINLLNADEECDLDYTPKMAKTKTVNYAISNSLGFGGHNVCILVGKVK